MKKKLQTILLVDDHEPTNVYNKIIIEESNCTENVVVVEDGQEALDYLTTEVDGQFPVPELIFLDINMPLMNGWEFLEHYKNISAYQKGKVIVVMLTASLNPDDEQRAKQNNDINGFTPKPLSEKSLRAILQKYFPSHFD